MSANLIQIISPVQAVSAREELNLSQAKVASDTGISRPYLSQFEGGKRILEDDKQQILLDYYLGYGWIYLEPIFADEKDDFLPYIIRDGFAVPESIHNQELEDLLSEHYENAEKIEQLKLTEVKRGSWLGSIDKEHANFIWLQVMMLAARQYTIKQLLHGQLDVGGEFVEQEKAQISTIGEYGDDMFYRTFVKREGVEFRV
ncbi:MAG: transcriptional regulator with XRE-family HTH domain [Oleiphilaceae bacterium]|jgi:transcriptional regulator with XRE-family HTH domain